MVVDVVVVVGFATVSTGEESLTIVFLASFLLCLLLLLALIGIVGGLDPTNKVLEEDAGSPGSLVGTSFCLSSWQDRFWLDDHRVVVVGCSMVEGSKDDDDDDDDDAVP